MPNPAHHHCHPFTDFYKGLTCAELKPLLIARKSDTLIFWKACLLVVPAGLDQRTYSIGTLQYAWGQQEHAFILDRHTNTLKVKK